MASYIDNNALDFGEITFAIPAQTFGITCSISTEEALPVVSEFALRMIHASGSMTPKQMQEFFGFSAREVSAVIYTLHEERLVKWEEEALELTHYARARFLESDDGIPRFFRIRDWSNDVSFDLMSFSPVKDRGSQRRPRAMVELTSNDVGRESQTRYWAERSFQENFRDIYRRGLADVYKISEVATGSRFFLPLPCTFRISVQDGLEITRSISDDVFAEKLEIAEAISEALAVRDEVDNSTMSEFINMFKDSVMAEYMSAIGFDVTRYLQEVHFSTTRAYDDGRYPVVGSLHLPSNRRMLMNKVKEINGGKDAVICWLAPQTRFWSRSRRAGRLLDDLVAELRRIENNGETIAKQEETHAGLSSTPPTHRSKVFLQLGGLRDTEFARVYCDTFPAVYGSTGVLLNGKLELFLVPGHFVCAIYHYQLDHPMSLPIGFVSSRKDTLEVARGLLSSLCTGNNRVYDQDPKAEGGAKDLGTEFPELTPRHSADLANDDHGGRPE